MSAYLIFRREKVLDERDLATYSNEATSTLAGHEVKVILEFKYRGGEGLVEQSALSESA